MEIFRKLNLWIDTVPRSGPEAMAVDEWLLEAATAPVLRVYRWSGAWASLGYFGKIATAREAFSEVQWVRRWTGGGMVDHRADWTYTIVAPHDEPLAKLRGAESYRILHQALMDTLIAGGISARLSSGTEETGGALCFENPVSYDLLGADGRKLAGAGQRRTRQGLLHQGSVAAPCKDGETSKRRAEEFAARISQDWKHSCHHPNPENLAQRISARYECDAWTLRR